MIENKRKNIFFTTISPGRIQTNISYSAMLADGTRHSKLDKAQAKGIKAEICAQKIIRAIQRDKRKVYILQWEMIMVILRKCLPFVFFRLVKRAKFV
jgi:short-subunit dehydrogenase